MKGIKAKENNFQLDSTNLSFFNYWPPCPFPKTLFGLGALPFGLGALQNVASFEAKVDLP